MARDKTDQLLDLMAYGLANPGSIKNLVKNQGDEGSGLSMFGSGLKMLFTNSPASNYRAYQNYSAISDDLKNPAFLINLLKDARIYQFVEHNNAAVLTLLGEFYSLPDLKQSLDEAGIDKATFLSIADQGTQLISTLSRADNLATVAPVVDVWLEYQSFPTLLAEYNAAPTPAVATRLVAMTKDLLRSGESVQIIRHNVGIRFVANTLLGALDKDAKLAALIANPLVMKYFTELGAEHPINILLGAYTEDHANGQKLLDELSTFITPRTTILQLHNALNVGAVDDVTLMANTTSLLARDNNFATTLLPKGTFSSACVAALKNPEVYQLIRQNTVQIGQLVSATYPLISAKLAAQGVGTQGDFDRLAATGLDLIANCNSSANMVAMNTMIARFQEWRLLGRPTPEFAFELLKDASAYQFIANNQVYLNSLAAEGLRNPLLQAYLLKQNITADEYRALTTRTIELIVDCKTDENIAAIQEILTKYQVFYDANELLPPADRLPVPKLALEMLKDKSVYKFIGQNTDRLLSIIEVYSKTAGVGALLDQYKYKPDSGAAEMRRFEQDEVMPIAARLLAMVANCQTDDSIAAAKHMVELYQEFAAANMSLVQAGSQPKPLSDLVFLLLKDKSSYQFIGANKAMLMPIIEILSQNHALNVALQAKQYRIDDTHSIAYVNNRELLDISALFIDLIADYKTDAKIIAVQHMIDKYQQFSAANKLLITVGEAAKPASEFMFELLGDAEIYAFIGTNKQRIMPIIERLAQSDVARHALDAQQYKVDAEHSMPYIRPQELAPISGMFVDLIAHCHTAENRAAVQIIIEKYRQKLPAQSYSNFMLDLLKDKVVYQFIGHNTDVLANFSAGLMDTAAGQAYLAKTGMSRAQFVELSRMVLTLVSRCQDEENIGVLTGIITKYQLFLEEQHAHPKPLSEFLFDLIKDPTIYKLLSNNSELITAIATEGSKIPVILQALDKQGVTPEILAKIVPQLIVSLTGPYNADNVRLIGVILGQYQQAQEVEQAASLVVGDDAAVVQPIGNAGAVFDVLENPAIFQLLANNKVVLAGLVDVLYDNENLRPHLNRYRITRGEFASLYGMILEMEVQFPTPENMTLIRNILDIIQNGSQREDFIFRLSEQILKLSTKEEFISILRDQPACQAAFSTLLANMLEVEGAGHASPFVREAVAMLARPGIGAAGLVEDFLEPGNGTKIAEACYELNQGRFCTMASIVVPMLSDRAAPGPKLTHVNKALAAELATSFFKNLPACTSALAEYRINPTIIDILAPHIVSNISAERLRAMEITMQVTMATENFAIFGEWSDLLVPQIIQLAQEVDLSTHLQIPANHTALVQVIRGAVGVPGPLQDQLAAKNIQPGLIQELAPTLVNVVASGLANSTQAELTDLYTSYKDMSSLALDVDPDISEAHFQRFAIAAMEKLHLDTYITEHLDEVAADIHRTTFSLNAPLHHTMAEYGVPDALMAGLSPIIAKTASAAIGSDATQVMRIYEAYNKYDQARADPKAKGKVLIDLIDSVLTLSVSPTVSNVLQNDLKTFVKAHNKEFAAVATKAVGWKVSKSNINLLADKSDLLVDCYKLYKAKLSDISLSNVFFAIGTIIKAVVLLGRYGFNRVRDQINGNMPDISDVALDRQRVVSAIEEQVAPARTEAAVVELSGLDTHAKIFDKHSVTLHLNSEKDGEHNFDGAAAVNTASQSRGGEGRAGGTITI